MNRSKTGALLGLALWAASATADAATLSLVPDTLTTTPGSTLQVNLVANGFGGSGNPLLSTFDLDFLYDPTRFTLAGILFGGSLGNPGAGEATTGTDNSTAGLLNLWELSLLEGTAAGCTICAPPYLENLQTSPFLLATISLLAITPGTGIFGLTVNVLGDADGNSVSVGPVAPVGVAVVPEPPSPGILGLGLLALFSRRRQCLI